MLHEIPTAFPVRLLVWLDDNKARKLKYNLLAAREQGHDTLLTFGGAYSNQLAAVAAAGRAQGFGTVGLVRGEATQPLNPTLAGCAAAGMQLHYLDRATYRRRADPDFLAALPQQYGPAYLLPEGGTNALALPGTAEIVADIRRHTAFNALAVAVGTGGTLAGLVTGLAGTGQAVGIAALKNGGFLRDEVARLLPVAYGNWTLHTDYHFGGYARYSAELLAFIPHFEARHGVLLDPIYTGKLLFGVLDLITKGHFAPGSTVVAVHTGGLQAWAGWQQRFGELPPLLP